MARTETMTTAYYRLFYASDPIVRQRRFQKALDSECGKILFDAFWLSDRESLALSKNIFQAHNLQICFSISHEELQSKTNEEVSFLSDFFSEIILELSATENFLSGHIETLYSCLQKLSFLITFNTVFDIESFLTLLPLWARKNIYFQPCGKRLTSKKIFNFGKKIEKKFSEIQFRPLPGLDQYDLRIPENVELQLQGQQLIELSLQESSVQISFILPTHNNSEFLKNCLRHLLNQKEARNNFEIIVVDDGSTQLNIEDLKAFLAPEKNNLNFSYYYLPKQNSDGSILGQFRAGLCRNFGYLKSRGEILSFLDSDMLVPENYFSCIQDALLKVDIVQFVRKHIQPRESTVFTNYNSVDTKNLFIEEASYWKPFFDTPDWMTLADFWKYTCTYSLSLHREHFKKLGKFRKTFVSYGFEDTDFGYRAALSGLHFHLEQTPLLHLTHFSDKARYHHSMFHKHKLLRITAKTFYLNHLSRDIYYKMYSLLD